MVYMGMCRCEVWFSSLLKMGKSIEIRKFWSEQLVENFSQEQNNDIGIKF